jgi:hypothetical protein
MIVSLVVYVTLVVVIFKKYNPLLFCHVKYTDLSLKIKGFIEYIVNMVQWSIGTVVSFLL